MVYGLSTSGAAILGIGIKQNSFSWTMSYAGKARNIFNVGDNSIINSIVQSFSRGGDVIENFWSGLGRIGDGNALADLAINNYASD